MNYDPRPLAPVNPKGLDEIAEALLKEPYLPSNSKGNISLEGKTSFWSIENVPYRNGVYRIDLQKHSSTAAHQKHKANGLLIRGKHRQTTNSM